MIDGIDRLRDKVLVDAYGPDEQLSAFVQAFETSARFPFAARVVGVPVEVTRVVYEGDERRGLLAICRREGQHHHVPLVDLTPGPVPVETSMLLEAYRRWWRLPPAPAEVPMPPSGGSWATALWPTRRSPSPRRSGYGPTVTWTRPRSTGASPTTSRTPWCPR
jgi:hypothetical protein